MRSSIRVYLFFLVFCSSVSLSAQNQLYNQIENLRNSGATFVAAPELFTPIAWVKSPRTSVEKTAQALQLNKAKLVDIMSQRPDALHLELPYGNTVIAVDLYQKNILSDRFSVKISETEYFNYTAGVYYRGVIAGEPNSVCAISFFDDDIIGVISHPQWGNLNLGKLPGKSDEFLLFNDNTLGSIPNFECSVEGTRESRELDPHQHAENAVAGCVEIYFEAAFSLYQNKGNSVLNTVNYVTGFFNIVSTIYNNEMITTNISQIYVWTVDDPYDFTDSSTGLNTFRNFRSNFQGDLAELLSVGVGYGGRAWLDQLCGGSPYGVSDIGSTYNSSLPPVYSWTVMVVTHELGHNFGSPHTHSCSWPGGAIDNCETPEGSCASGPAPTNGGTIMSYCHLNVGINFANNFGPLPGQLIRNETTNALTNNCIVATCPTSTCTAPTNLSVTSAGSTSATVTWAATSGATNYNVQWRVAGGNPPAWNTASGVSAPFVITGLTPSTDYEFQVQAVCGSTPSRYTTGAVFKTAASLCAEPSNLTATPSGSGVALNWTENGTATTWQIEYGVTGFTQGTGTVITVTSKPYTLTGLTIGVTYQFYVRATCGSPNGDSFWIGPQSFDTPPPNDLIANAITLTVGTACTGNIYTNTGATVSGNEFSPSQSNGGDWLTGTSHTVWFKFVAPASGSVLVTTDISPLGTLIDPQVALYSSSNPTSLNHHLASNEDGGTIGVGYATFVYYSGLTPGTTYYVQVDGWSNDRGTFCIEVREQFALPTPTTCTTYRQGRVDGASAPNKWFNIYSRPGSANTGLPIAAVKSNVNLDTVRVQEIRSSSVPTAANGVRYMQRYFNFSSTQNNNAPKEVRLFYTTAEFTNLRTAVNQPSASIDDLNIYHYDGVNEDCTPNNNSTSTGVQVITNVSATSIGTSGFFYLNFNSPSFSEMGAMLGTAALPVELTYFNGTKENMYNLLRWSTSAEVNTDYFAIERSTDGTSNWEPIGKVTAGKAPNAQNERTYELRDNRPTDQAYYRLTINDLDGKLSYSDIVYLERKTPSGIIRIVPNPAIDHIQIDYLSAIETEARFCMIGADGRIVIDQMLTIPEGQTTFPIDMSALPSGLYYININGQSAKSVIKR
jgi:hypothetical protein